MSANNSNSMVTTYIVYGAILAIAVIQVVVAITMGLPWDAC